MRIWYRLKGLCLKITVSNKERKYSYYLCQYHNFEVNAWSTMNDVHDKYKGDTFLSIHLGLFLSGLSVNREPWFHEIILKWYDIFLSLVNNFVTEKIFKCLWAGENHLKNHNNLKHYFDVILLSNVIWVFGPNVTRRVTYITLNNTITLCNNHDVFYILLKCLNCLYILQIYTNNNPYGLQTNVDTLQT